MNFAWRDGERLIRFGRGVAAEAVDTLGGPGYRLLTTERAAAALPDLAGAAAAVWFVPAGTVPGLAASALAWAREAGEDPRIVALGGGRVIDSAKAVAAALGGAARALAVPTTLSGAELTRSHRHAEGVDPATPLVRCAVVVSDPALSASQPEAELAASALNALGHAFEAPCTTRANPVATLAARDAARRLAGAFLGTEVDRDACALGALLAGYALDGAGYGLHHVVAQTLAFAGIASHGQANAIMLPHCARALAARAPAEYAALADALGAEPADVAARIGERTGATRLRELGAEPQALDAAAEAAARRPQLDFTPPRAERDELRALYAAAY